MALQAGPAAPSPQTHSAPDSESESLAASSLPRVGAIAGDPALQIGEGTETSGAAASSSEKDRPTDIVKAEVSTKHMLAALVEANVLMSEQLRSISARLEQQISSWSEASRASGSVSSRRPRECEPGYVSEYRWKNFAERMRSLNLKQMSPTHFVTVLEKAAIFAGVRESPHLMMKIKQALDSQSLRETFGAAFESKIPGMSGFEDLVEAAELAQKEGAFAEKYWVQIDEALITRKFQLNSMRTKANWQKYLQAHKDLFESVGEGLTINNNSERFVEYGLPLFVPPELRSKLKKELMAAQGLPVHQLQWPKPQKLFDILYNLEVVGSTPNDLAAELPRSLRQDIVTELTALSGDEGGGTKDLQLDQRQYGGQKGKRKQASLYPYKPSDTDVSANDLQEGQPIQQQEPKGKKRRARLAKRKQANSHPYKSPSMDNPANYTQEGHTTQTQAPIVEPEPFT